MASTYTRGGRHYARWKDASGRWRHQATKCRTKRDAERFAVDLERKAERQRAGLEPLPTDAPTMTFAQLYEWWWSEYGSNLRGATDSYWRKRLLPDLGCLSLQEVTAPIIEGVLQQQAGELSAKSLNGLRGMLHTIFAKAKKRGIWVGSNPAADVERRRAPRRIFDTLRAEEVPALLHHVGAGWRALFATAVWTGMRKGELLGLRKRDVNLLDGEITVRRSYDATTTKGDHEEVIPIADPLMPLLREAIEDSPSDYVFPAADGSMRPPETRLQHVLRRALGRAGIVLGYEHVCRRKGCAFKKKFDDDDERRCPKCNMLLYARAIPRPLRFHDLRGTTATLLARAGVSLVVAQRMLRHTDPRLTANIYSRVDIGDLRAGINRLGIPQPLVASLSYGSCRSVVGDLSR